MKKVTLHILAIVCLFLGALFFIIPGPSLIFILIGLTLLSIYHTKARFLLKKCQTTFKRSCIYIDKVIYKR